MSDVIPETSPTQSAARKWQPLSAIDRRVIGVLAEKAKTTPDIYPMSINAIVTGCNQKSNRAPLMQLDAGEVEESLDRLRQLGAAGMVEGYGRVQRYRHYLYEWLGVDKVELAVMTELLLRGDQTVGELRGRAARMEPIADVAAMRPVIESLKAKGLVVSLTSEGRGHVVTHALLRPRELEAAQASYQGASASAAMQGPRVGGASTHDVASQPAIALHTVSNAGSEGSGSASLATRRDLEALRAEVAQLRADLDDARNMFQRIDDEVRSLRESLGG